MEWSDNHAAKLIRVICTKCHFIHVKPAHYYNRNEKNDFGDLQNHWT